MSEFALSAVLWAVFLAFALLLILVAALFALLAVLGGIMVWGNILELLQESRAVDPESKQLTVNSEQRTVSRPGF